MRAILPGRPLIWTPATQLNASHSLARQLLMYLPCDEGGGTLLQDLMSSDPGTLSAVSGSVPGWIGSPWGPAVNLNNGNTEYIAIKDGGSANIHNAYPPNPGAGLSVAIRLYWLNSTEAYNCVFDKEVGGGGWTFLLKSSQQPAWYVGGAGSDPITTNTVPFNSWTHLVVCANPVASTLKFYMNGILNASVSFNGSNSPTNVDLWIGRSIFGAGRWINGYVRDIGVWNRELTPDEVWQLYAIPGVLARPFSRVFLGTAAAGAFTNVYPVKRTQVLSADLFDDFAGGSAADLTQILTEEFYN